MVLKKKTVNAIKITMVNKPCCLLPNHTLPVQKARNRVEFLFNTVSEEKKMLTIKNRSSNVTKITLGFR